MKQINCEKDNVYSMSEIKRQSITLFDLTGNMCIKKLKYFAASHLSTDDHKSTARTDFGVTNKF